MEGKKKGITLLFIVAIIWGTGFIATQIALDNFYSSGFIMFVRFGLAALVFGLIFRKDIKNISKYDLLAGFITGLTLFLGFTFQTYGLKYTSPSTNAFLTATNIIIVPFFSWMAFKKKPSKQIFISALICLIGVWVLSYNKSVGIKLGMGEILTLIGSVAFAFHTVAIGFFTKKIEVKKINFLQLTFAGILSFFLFVFTGGSFSDFIPKISILSVLYLAIFSTCIAYFLQAVAQKYVSPSETAIIMATESLFASFFSIILGYENISVNLLLGGILILFAIILSEKKPRRKNILK